MCCCRCCSRRASPRTPTAHSFTIDDVADSLLRKLANRVPAVLAGESISLEDQLAQWEERKAAEKFARLVDGRSADGPACIGLGPEGD